MAEISSYVADFQPNSFETAFDFYAIHNPMPGEESSPPPEDGNGLGYTLQFSDGSTVELQYSFDYSLYTGWDDNAEEWVMYQNTDGFWVLENFTSGSQYTAASPSVDPPAQIDTITITPAGGGSDSGSDPAGDPDDGVLYRVVELDFAFPWYGQIYDRATIYPGGDIILWQSAGSSIAEIAPFAGAGNFTYYDEQAFWNFGLMGDISYSMGPDGLIVDFYPLDTSALDRAGDPNNPPNIEFNWDLVRQLNFRIVLTAQGEVAIDYNGMRTTASGLVHQDYSFLGRRATFSSETGLQAEVTDHNYRAVRLRPDYLADPDAVVIDRWFEPEVAQIAVGPNQIRSVPVRFRSFGREQAYAGRLEALLDDGTGTGTWAAAADIDVTQSVDAAALADSDGDGLLDAWEIDTFGDLTTSDGHDDQDHDGDGVSDADEHELGLNANDADSDNDGISDGYEVEHGLNAKIDDRYLDKDGDGVSNLEESILGLSASNRDSDGDYLNDGAELGLPPHGGGKGPGSNGPGGGDGGETGNEDGNDGAENGGEDDGSSDPPIYLPTGIIIHDIQNPGGTTPGNTNNNEGDQPQPNNPNDQDSPDDIDGDGWTNEYEARMGTDPENKDTDGDGVPDPDDRIPYMAEVSSAPVAVPRYVVIDLGEGAKPRMLNEHNEVLFEHENKFKFWSQGKELTIGSVDDLKIEGLTNDGIVYGYFLDDEGAIDTSRPGFIWSKDTNGGPKQLKELTAPDQGAPYYEEHEWELDTGGKITARAKIEDTGNCGPTLADVAWDRNGERISGEWVEAEEVEIYFDVPGTSAPTNPPDQFSSDKHDKVWQQGETIEDLLGSWVTTGLHWSSKPADGEEEESTQGSESSDQDEDESPCGAWLNPISGELLDLRPYTVCKTLDGFVGVRDRDGDGKGDLIWDPDYYDDDKDGYFDGDSSIACPCKQIGHRVQIATFSGEEVWSQEQSEGFKPEYGIRSEPRALQGYEFVGDETEENDGGAGAEDNGGDDTFGEETTQDDPCPEQEAPTYPNTTSTAPALWFAASEGDEEAKTGPNSHEHVNEQGEKIGNYYLLGDGDPANGGRQLELGEIGRLDKDFVARTADGLWANGRVWTWEEDLLPGYKIDLKIYNSFKAVASRIFMLDVHGQEVGEPFGALLLPVTMHEVREGDELIPINGQGPELSLPSPEVTITQFEVEIDSVELVDGLPDLTVAITVTGEIDDGPSDIRDNREIEHLSLIPNGDWDRFITLDDELTTERNPDPNSFLKRWDKKATFSTTVPNVPAEFGRNTIRFESEAWYPGVGYSLHEFEITLSTDHDDSVSETDSLVLEFAGPVLDPGASDLLMATYEIGGTGRNGIGLIAGND